MLFKSFALCILLFGTACNSSQEKVTTDELMTILDIQSVRVPSFPKKQWITEIIPDTLQKRKVVTIDEVLSSKTNSLIALKFDNDTTVTFTLIQNKNTSSQGTFQLKQSRYEIEWNNYPELLYGNTFVVATIAYEQNDHNQLENLTDLIVVKLIDELKFP